MTLQEECARPGRARGITDGTTRMNQPIYNGNGIAGFIWSIADDVLRDVYVRGKYRDVILPMTVIRRLDCLLEPTKDAVLKMKQQLDKAKIANQDAALTKAAGQPSTTPLNSPSGACSTTPNSSAPLRRLPDGFSRNVQEIIDKFDFRNQLRKLDEADVLGHLISKFVDPGINLSPEPVCDGQGNVRLPGLDNHHMGSIFEELIRRFNEENNEEAGEHFTSRDAVRLMANLIFLPIADAIESGTYRLRLRMRHRRHADHRGRDAQGTGRPARKSGRNPPLRPGVPARDLRHLQSRPASEG